jgi:hypothetical protein
VQIHGEALDVPPPYKAKDSALIYALDLRYVTYLQRINNVPNA